ncbi:MAG: HlyC/CorC family transporter [Acidimicrobiales bacterium]|nr:HlyC/CorC family transporter [Acidimicrobiales bacterium]
MAGLILAVTVTGADVAMIAAIVVLLVLLMFLALAETGLTRMNRVRAMALEEEGLKGSNRLVSLVNHPEQFINSVLLLVLVLQTVQTALTTLVANRLFGSWGVAVGLFLNVVLFFVLAEAAPKTWAVQHPDRAALGTARPVYALSRFAPLRVMSRGLIGLTNVILPGKGLKKGPFLSEEELLAMTDVAAEEEVIEREERALIHSIIEFGDTVVREVMVPRPDMVTVEARATLDEAITTLLQRGYSRVPVVGEGIDDVVGVVHVRDLIRAVREGQGGEEVRGTCRPARFVPESKRVAELMREMQREKYHQAVVVDEYGGTAGIVTLEDLIEELVGEIVDEFDVEERPQVERLPGGDVLVDARMPVDEANELLGADLPDDEWDTLGGLVYGLLGRVPAEGESVVFDGLRFQTEKVVGRRISRVRVARLADWERPERDEEG